MAISLPPDNVLNNLEEVFCCYICLERLQDTRLCPKCSKMCCFQCIRRWLIEQKPSCPHCRSSLLLHELVKCRWVDDLLPRLENHSKKEALARDKCPTHSEQLSVYCITCGVCVCHQCALWAGEHTEHKFQPVTEIYEAHKLELYDEVKNLKKRLAEILDCIADIERQLTSYNQERETQLKQISKVMKDITSRIDIQISAQLAKLRHQQSTLQKDSDIVEKKIGEVLNKIETSVKSDLISSFPELLQELIGMSSQLAKPPTANLTFLGKELEFTNELVPNYLEKEFIIEDFSTCRRRGSPIYSPPLTLHGQIWKLKVYPNGNGVFRGDFLSVFLELSQGFAGSAKYEYRVSMVHFSRNSDRTVYREFLSDFEPGECWGYNRFYRLEHLETKGYLDSVEDVLTLQFAVRSPTYYHDSMQQNKHVNNLNLQVDSLRERLRDTERSDDLDSQEIVLAPSSEDEHERIQGTTDLTGEQLDRAFLLRASDEGSEASDIVLALSDEEQSASSRQEDPEDFTNDIAGPDSQGSLEIPGLDPVSQEFVAPLENSMNEMSVTAGEDMDLTLVSNSEYTPASDQILIATQDPEDSDSQPEDNGLSIHSIESPPTENISWSTVHVPVFSENRGLQLSEILTQIHTEVVDDSAREATRFTDSLPNNFPDMQANILACLREVANNPLIGLSPGSSFPEEVPSNPLDILPLNSYSSHSETEEGTDYNTNWIEERETNAAGDDPPE
ncbi:E3 ubiquitin-protein ligase TRIM37 [Oopsacas minuta]|uniref:E3 ubiquitin-protein ligase TRIM37 n=1 Tax=Oopsacas minuta TaxID=111878 RepID=A0AAV7K6K0_9METZ|nr:E3 ubiquitin-protein ligase TRIM37 [Oopsacas minuta]